MNECFSSGVWKAPCCNVVSKGNRIIKITYTELRRGIDELELHLLQVTTRGVHHQRLAQSNDTLLGSGNRALENEEVVLNNTVMGEATHRGNLLLGDVGFGRGVALIGGRSNAVDLLVELSTVMVSVCRRINTVL